MDQELKNFLQGNRYEIIGGYRGSSGRCWLVGARRGTTKDRGDKLCQDMSALSRCGSEVLERRFTFSISRTALGSDWVKEQINDPDKFLLEAGIGHFFKLLASNDEDGEVYPELLLSSRSSSQEFQIPTQNTLSDEIIRVKKDILKELQGQAYLGHGGLSRDRLADIVCTRDSILDRVLITLEEQDYIRLASNGTTQISTTGETELNRLIATDPQHRNKTAMSHSDITTGIKKYDLFVSHASEDKEPFVKQLVERLIQAGLRVWYDDVTLKLGDSLRKSIDNGLKNSTHGLVILSHSFFAKNWPQKELDGLFALADQGERRILPIWHELTGDELKKYSPMLADIKAVKSSQGLEEILKAVLEVVQGSKANQ